MILQRFEWRAFPVVKIRSCWVSSVRFAAAITIGSPGFFLIWDGEDPKIFGRKR